MAARRMSGEQLLKKLHAKGIERTRTWLIALQKGGIESLSEPLCRALRDILGLNPTELTEDPSMLGADFLPEASPLARWVGQHWDMLPKDMQDALRAQIEAYVDLVRAQPALDQLIRGKGAKVVPFDTKSKRPP